MIRVVTATAVFLALSVATSAQKMSDCHTTKDAAVAIPACDAVIANQKIDKEKRAIAHAVKGKLLYRAGDHDNAILEVTRGIALDPKLAILYSTRGSSYLSKGEREKALADFGEAIRLDPKDMESYVNRAVVYFNGEEYDKGIADMDVAIGISPSMALLYTYRGKMHLSAGNAEKAASDYRKVLELDPANKEAKEVLADLGMEPK